MAQHFLTKAFAHSVSKALEPVVTWPQCWSRLFGAGAIFQHLKCKLHIAASTAGVLAVLLRSNLMTPPAAGLCASTHTLHTSHLAGLQAV